MSARLVTLAERRNALLARSDRNRAELGVIVGGLERKFIVAEKVVAAARGLSRYRALFGVAGMSLIIMPLASKTWMRRVMWLVPLALQAYRAVKTHREARPESPLDDHS